MTEEEYRAARSAQQKAIEESAKMMSEMVPTPTQEELDLMRLGLMHVDEKGGHKAPAHPTPPARRPDAPRASA